MLQTSARRGFKKCTSRVIDVLHSGIPNARGRLCMASCSRVSDPLCVQRRSFAEGLSAEEEALIAQLVQAAPQPVAAAPAPVPPFVPVAAPVEMPDPVNASLSVETASESRPLSSTPHRQDSGAVPVVASHRAGTRTTEPPIRRVTVFPKTWQCPSCQHLNDGSKSSSSWSASKFFCAACEAPFPGVHDWVCASCYVLNARSASSCASCQAEKSVWWACPGCTTRNAVSVHVCHQCGHALKEAEASDASSLRCDRCQTLNAAVWDLCACCLAPLPRLVAMVASPAKPSATADKAVFTASEVGALNAGQDSSVSDLPLIATVPAGSWHCVQCNVLQRRNASFCDICLRPREVATGIAAGPQRDTSPNAGVEEGGEAPLAKPTGDPLTGDWQCPYCRQYCSVSTLACCGHERQVPPGYWPCRRCCSTNRNDRTACLGCGSQPDVMPWCCAVCKTPNDEGHFACAACGTPHPLLWQCTGCHTVVSVGHQSCPQCGATPPQAEVPVVCHVCRAPNVRSRRGCFRCRARLHTEDWTCPECQQDGNTSARCDRCGCARQYNLEEETWVCQLCETAVTSGGDLPVWKQCPFCNTPRPKDGTELCYPSRWVCKQCGLFNRTAQSTCGECGCQREVLPFRSTATCPGCFRQTVLDERERCEHCGESLTDVLSDSLLNVSLETSPLSELSRLAEEQLSMP